MANLKRLSFKREVELTPQILDFFEGFHLEGASLNLRTGSKTPETRQKIDNARTQINNIVSAPNFDEQETKYEIENISQYIRGLLGEKLEWERESEDLLGCGYYEEPDSDDDDDFALNEREKGWKIHR